MKQLFFAVIALLLVGCSEPTPQSELKANIEDMISLLEDGDVQTLLQEHLDLSDMSIPPTDIPQKKLTELRNYLDQALTLEPDMNQSSTEAVFTIPGLDRPMRFVKKDQRWLLKNR